MAEERTYVTLNNKPVWDLFRSLKNEAANYHNVHNHNIFAFYD